MTSGCFKNIKYALKGRFQDIEDIEKESDEGTESYSTKGFPKVAASLD
jgi:hypothetical protein